MENKSERQLEKEGKENEIFLGGSIEKNHRPKKMDITITGRSRRFTDDKKKESYYYVRCVLNFSYYYSINKIRINDAEHELRLSEKQINDHPYYGSRKLEAFLDEEIANNKKREKDERMNSKNRSEKRRKVEIAGIFVFIVLQIN